MAGGGPGPSAPRTPLLLLLLFLALPPRPRAAPSGSPPGAGPTVSCLAPAPSLSWYLQEGGGGGGGEPGGRGEPAAGRRRRRRGQGPGARRLELPLLNCSATDPETGLPAEASVLLEVQIQPELVQLEGAYSEEEEGEEGEAARGLAAALVLLVLVQARPPAQITWVDPEGRTTVNTSHFLVVEAGAYAWPSGQTQPQPQPQLRLQLRSRGPDRSPDRSSPATPEEGLEEQRRGPRAANASLLRLPGLLGARVELPLLALVSGAAGALLLLGSLLSCLLFRKKGKEAHAAGPPFLVPPPPPSDPNHLKPPRMPRANISLPANLQLNDLSAIEAQKGQEKSAGDAPVEEEEERALSEPENSLALVERGLGRFPMVGYIYRASSMSSDEIWL